MREFVEACLAQARVDAEEMRPRNLLRKGRSRGERIYMRVVGLCETSLRGFLVKLPLFLLERIPHAASLCSIGYLYVFAQCTGMAWMLLLHFASVLTQAFARCLKDSSASCLRPPEHIEASTQTAGSAASSIFSASVQSGGEREKGTTTSKSPADISIIEPWNFNTPSTETLIVFYLYYAMGRMLIFVVYGLYTIGWESFHDFPTVRKTVSLSMREIAERYTVRVTCRSRSLSPAAGLDSTATSRTFPPNSSHASSGSPLEIDEYPPIVDTDRPSTASLESRSTRANSSGVGSDTLVSSHKIVDEFDRSGTTTATAISAVTGKAARVVELSPRESQLRSGSSVTEETAGLRQRHPQNVRSHNSSASQIDGRSAGDRDNRSDILKDGLEIVDHGTVHMKGPTTRSRSIQSEVSTEGEEPMTPNTEQGANGAGNNAFFSSEDEERARLRREKKKTGGRRALLILPLVWLFVLCGWLAVSSFYFDFTEGLSSADMRNSSSSTLSMSESIMRPTGRLHRCFLFLMLLSLVQWAAQYLFLFPNLFSALLLTPRSTALFGFYFLFSIIGGARLVSWFLFPQGKQTKMFFGVIPHHLLDVVLVMAWMGWMMCTLLHLFGSRTAFKQTGFFKERFNDDQLWRNHIAIFKVTYIVPLILHFFRGSLFSSHLGIRHAMNDSLIIMVMYPLLLLLIWTATFLLVAALRRGRRIGMLQLATMVPLWFVSQYVCWRYLQLESKSAICLVWAHGVRQSLRLFSRKTPAWLAAVTRDFFAQIDALLGREPNVVDRNNTKKLSAAASPTSPGVSTLSKSNHGTATATPISAVKDEPGFASSKRRARMSSPSPESPISKISVGFAMGSAGDPHGERDEENEKNPIMKKPRQSMQYVIDGYGKMLLVLSVVYLGTCLFLAFVGEMQRIYNILPMTISMHTSASDIISFEANQRGAAENGEQEATSLAAGESDKVDTSLSGEQTSVTLLPDPNFVSVSHVVSHLQVKLADAKKQKSSNWVGGLLASITGGDKEQAAVSLSGASSTAQSTGKNHLGDQQAQPPDGKRPDEDGSEVESEDVNVLSSTSAEPGNEFRSRNPFWTVPKYAACGQLYHGLTLLDWALVAESVYLESKEEREYFLEKVVFPNSWYEKDLSQRPQVRTHSFSKHGSAAYMEIFFPEQDMTVVAIKGTDPLKLLDFLEDLRMWRDAVVVSLLANLFPAVRAWPKATTEMVIRFQHEFLENLGLVESHWAFDELLHKYGGSETVLVQPTGITELQNIKSENGVSTASAAASPAPLDADAAEPPPQEKELSDENPPAPKPSKTVFVGHSMGGGIASILGFLNHAPVVAFQPPGVYHSIAKFQQVKRDMKAYDFVHHETLNILVEDDWINNVFDEHGGLLQQIGCDYPNRSMYLSCHLLESVINHLYKSCGEDRADDLVEMVEEKIVKPAGAGSAAASTSTSKEAGVTRTTKVERRISKKPKRFDYVEWKFEVLTQSTWDTISEEVSTYVRSSTFYSYFVALSSFRYTAACLALVAVVRLL
ncbi:unnamed protein product [Amoebophrya sp. A120]|nr:unnamed protein product [Amoebophrya sp. A120]|eukprot:GSA120T00024030001.1